MRDYLVCKSYVAVTAASLFSHLLLHLHEHIIIGIRLLPLHHPVMVAGVTSIWSQRCCCYDATTNAPVAAHWSVKRPPLPSPHTHPRPPPLGYSGFSFLCPQIVSPPSRRRPRKPCDRLVNAGSCEVRGKTCAKKTMLCLDR